MDRRWRFAAVVRGYPQVSGMQEGGSSQADVDECCLHARQYAGHLALVNVADDATRARAFDMKLLQHTVFDDGDACLLRGDVYKDLFTHTSSTQCRLTVVQLQIMVNPQCRSSCLRFSK